MNRRDIFKAFALAPVAVLPAAKVEPPEPPKEITIQLPAAMPVGQSVTIVQIAPGQIAVFK